MAESKRNQIRMRGTIKHFAQFTVGEVQGIYKNAIQEIIRDAQKAKPSKHKFDERSTNVTGGSMPVDTGALRASLISEIDGGRLNIAKKKSKRKNYDSVDATVLLAKVKLGDQVLIGWTVKYAAFQEFGTDKMSGNFFMTNAVKRWQQHVNVAVAKQKIKRNQLGRGIGGTAPRTDFQLT